MSGWSGRYFTKENYGDGFAISDFGSRQRRDSLATSLRGVYREPSGAPRRGQSARLHTWSLHIRRLPRSCRKRQQMGRLTFESYRCFRRLVLILQKTFRGRLQPVSSRFQESGSNSCNRSAIIHACKKSSGRSPLVTRGTGPEV